MHRRARVGIAGTIVTICLGSAGSGAATGCFSGSSTPGDKADAASQSDSPAFEAGPADGNVTQEASADTGSGDASDGGIVCTGSGASGTFTCAGNLGTARVAAGIAPLPGGKALVAGGWNATSQTLTSAEVYDSATNAFTPTGSMTSAHLWGAWGTSLPALAGGNVLAAGGLDNTGALVSVAEVYSPTTGMFSTTGPLVTAVISMFPLVLSDGSVLFTGGWNSTTGAPPTPGWMYTGSGTSEVQRYTPSTGKFADTGPLAESRLVGCNTLSSAGDPLAIGGSTGATTTEPNVEQYDPIKGEWLTLGTLTSVPGCTVAFTLTGGSVLLVGTGSTANADVLDVAALTTTPTTGFPAAWVPYYVQLQTGDVLAYGGTLNGAPTATAMVYGAATNAWKSVGPMAQVRTGAMSATLLTTGEVLIVGGTDGVSPVLATAEVYHP